MTSSSQSRYQITAYVFSGICLFTAAILGLFLVFGPKEGMEAMVIIIPWFLAGAAHLTIGIAAIICALCTRSFLKNSWIYVYFLLFFGLNGYYLAIVNHVDVAIERRIDAIRSPQETELYGLLSKLHLQGMTSSRADTTSLKRARLLVQSGVDLTYVLRGRHEPRMQPPHKYCSPMGHIRTSPTSIRQPRSSGPLSLVTRRLVWH